MKHNGRFVHVARNRPRRVVVGIDPAVPEGDVTVTAIVRVEAVLPKVLVYQWPERGAVETLFREAKRRRA